MPSKKLSEINLNEAFGFATILAAIEGIRATFAKEFKNIEIAPALFLVYFTAFRIKMYLDDDGHDFKSSKALDIFIALISWLAFLISVSALTTSVALAVKWTLVAIGVSTLWILYTIIATGKPKIWRMLWFGLMNVFHCIGLTLGLNQPSLWVIIFPVLTALVFVDSIVTREKFNN